MVAWFATNHVAANLVMGFAIFAGLASLSRIPVKLYPDIDIPLIVVTVPYLGAAPEEVESGVCSRIEESLVGIVGIREIRSLSAEGLCTVYVEMFHDTDRFQTLGEVENQINAIDTFPEESERPIVQLATSNKVVIEVAVTGPTDARMLKEAGRQVRDDILKLPGITHVSIANERPYEISVEVSESSLSRNNLTFGAVADALRRRSLDLPGGSIKTEQGEILLRTAGQAYWGHELENLLVTTRSDGTRVLLRDVARVVDGFADTGQGLRFNGQPAALVQVGRVGNQDVRRISDQVNRFVAGAAARYPEGVQLTIWKDESITLAVRLQALLDSGIQGLLLVLILLALFLRPNLANWVAAGIPIAFLGGIFLIYWFGLSIDALSVMGFILALGMLVDDAVVVGENVYSAQARGAGQLAGAIEGAQEVLVPVTFGVVTTIVAFLPLLFAVGTLGQVYGFMAATVICCLVFSLIECQMVLPAHLGHGSGRMPLGDFGLTLLAVGVIAAFVVTSDMRTGTALAVAFAAAVWAAHLTGALSRLAAGFTHLQLLFEKGLNWLIDNPFHKLAERAFRQRLLTLAIALAALASAASLVVGGHLPFSMRTPQKGDAVTARLTMPMGVSEAAMQRAIDELADSARAVQLELADRFEDAPVLHILETMGGHFAAGSRVGFVVADTGAHLGEVTMQLTPGQHRSVSTDAVAATWRERVGPIADAVELSYITDRLRSAPEIDIRVSGTDWDDMRAVVGAIRGRLAEFAGVHEITDSLNTGKAEIKLSVTPAGEALGISLADLGRQVRQAFYGEEAQRIQRGRDDIRIMVRYTEQERRSLESLYGLRIRTSSGGEVPFAIVAQVESGRGFSVIERIDGTRFAWVTADVDPTVTSAAAVLSSLDDGFLESTVALYPGVSYWFRSAQEQSELVETLGPLFLFVLLAIYALLAMPLGSYTQPLIIMSVLPFALVGAVWGHALLKPFGAIHGLSLASLFGVVAACGVVVNSTLVLIHGVNRFRAGGASLFDALVNSALTRFRPILITTATTFAGLLPLMLTDTAQAQLLVPMAISLAFGILVSAPAALLVVPAFWLVLHDISGGAKRVSGLVGGVIGTAPRLTAWMSRHPYVRESLRSQEFTKLQLPDAAGLDAETTRAARQGLVRLYYDREFSAAEMRNQFSALAARAPGTDKLVKEARNWAEQRTIQLGVHMASGALAPIDAAKPLTGILDTCLSELLTATRREFASENGAPPRHRLCLIALGAAGRREFANGAPLQLLFVYDHDPIPAGAITDSPQAWHEQLLQRFMVLVRDLSSDGLLYEAMPPRALRLDGELISAIPMQRLREYLEAPPDPVELRMLAHARVIAAEHDLGADFSTLRQQVLARGTGLRPTVRDISELRRQATQRIDAANIWAVGTFRGGLGDLELAAEYLEIAGGAPHSEPVGLRETFEEAAHRGLLETDAARDLIEAATLWQNLDGFFRMTCGGAFNPAAITVEQQQTIAELAGADSFEHLLRLIAETAVRTSVRIHELFARVMMA